MYYKMILKIMEEFIPVIFLIVTLYLLWFFYRDNYEEICKWTLYLNGLINIFKACLRILKLCDVLFFTYKSTDNLSIVKFCINVCLGYMENANSSFLLRVYLVFYRTQNFQDPRIKPDRPDIFHIQVFMKIFLRGLFTLEYLKKNDFKKIY